ncbi:ErmE/ErmH/ErmO/ErmR family 23S rRNA (adenine(2058)-N(6))-methyltransferase [Actinomadura kijaniata]|uniref:ErmE/ErmH/ErmO/ErmR family 23S rRNA (adenine(2058)-N(6))-methyltransferase n=1 Tax=Actinomadura kijaniata TaxID=46161 RepID=UPI0008353A03|nr:ErmE/ErmH/ErmO/ErmR family 23S rRNA (adenine(2058)-N(6))-methyltransferase [Actinomadura kijaniata]
MTHRAPRDHHADRTDRAQRARPTGSARDRARRTLSQNFLADPAALARYVRAVDTGPGELVVEVGAGDGRITAALARRAAHVIAYEIDPHLVSRLRRRCADLPDVTVVAGDFLRSRPPRRAFHLTGNIPYAATARIVTWALEAPHLTAATLITQREYARKRTGDYGRWSRLTVASWPLFDWRLLGRIDRDRFRPVPRVDAAILGLRRRPAPLLPPEALADYRACVATGFAGRGGTLRASLREHHPRRRVEAALRTAGIDRDAVVAHVHPDQWITLFAVLYDVRHTMPHDPPR